MQHWVLDQRAPQGAVDAGLAGTLIKAIGSPDRGELARAVLQVCRSALAIEHCTIFGFEADREPRVVSGASVRDPRIPYDTGATYIRHFHTKDVAHALFRGVDRDHLLMHRRTRDEVADAEYRSACFDRIAISDRLSILVNERPDAWLAVNIYRDRADGLFTPAEIERVQTLAPMVALAVARHCQLAPDDKSRNARVVRERLTALCPALTERERAVVLRMAEGMTTDGIAADLGIKPTSIVTYRNRAYQRLGINSRQQLFALLLREENTA